MGKAKRERKKETADMKDWFNEFAVACPARYQMKDKVRCGLSFIPAPKKAQALECSVLNCAPLFMANRLIQMTLGPRIYKDDKTNTPGKHPVKEK